MDFYNMKTREYKVIDKLHDIAVKCILKLKGNIYASCSGDSTIKIWEYSEE